MEDKKKVGPSFLGTIATTAPILGIAGYSIHKGFKTIATEKQSSVDKTLSVLQGMQQTQAGTSEFLSNMKSNASLLSPGGEEIAREAWNQALKRADSLALKGMGPLADSISKLPNGHINSTIMQIMQKDKSNLANRVYRAFEQNVAALSGQTSPLVSFGTVAEVPINKGEVKGLPSNLADRIRNLEKVLGPSSALWYSRPGWDEEEFGTHVVNFGGVDLRLPSIPGLSETQKGGILVEGMTQNTRRISPAIGIAEKATGNLTTMDRNEFFLKNIEEFVLPRVTKGELKNDYEIKEAIGELEQKLYRTLESSPNVSSAVRTRAIELDEAHRKAAIDIYERGMTGYDLAGEDLFHKTVREHNLHGGVGPSGLAKSRASTVPVGQSELFPSLVSTGARPEQSLREWGLTNKAKMKMTEQANKRYARYREMYGVGEAQSFAGATNPHLKVMYIDPERMESTLRRRLSALYGPGAEARVEKEVAAEIEALGLEEGVSVANSRLKDILEFDTIGSEKFELGSMNPEVVDALRTSRSPNIKYGDVIGFNDKGPITHRYGKDILGGSDHKGSSGSSYVSMNYRQTETVQHGSKIFNNKSLLMMQQEMDFNRKVFRASNYQKFSNNTDIISNIKTLKKDPAKHAEQMFTAMAEIINNRDILLMKAGTEYPFIENPVSLARSFEKEAIGQGGNVHHNLIKNLMSFGINEAQLTKEEFGGVFGSVPSIIDEKDALDIATRAGVSSSYAQEMIDTYAPIGINKVAYGGPGELTGAGAMGSVEPRITQELRTSSGLGQLGMDIADDITRRLAYTNPEKLKIHEELGKSLMSIKEHITPEKGARTFTAGTQHINEFKDFVKTGGGWLNPGKGQTQIYIPGSEVTDVMRGYQVRDEEMFGNVYKQYEDLARSAHEMHMGENVGIAGFQKQKAEFIADIGYHWAPGGKGLGGIERGKLIGSAFLTGVPRTEAGISGRELAQGTGSLQVAGITESRFKSMIKEMQTSGLYKGREGYFENMMERFMRDESVSGLLVRHPAIGSYSSQLVNFRKIAGSDDQIVLPDITHKMSSGKSIQLGPLVGTAGDFDADIFSAMLASPDTESAIQKTLGTNSEYNARHIEHQIRYQMLGRGGRPTKTNTLGSFLSARDQELADIQKLGTVQRRVPLISNELSSAKRAIAAFGSGAQAADAKTLLEWLEQTPIAAKHVSAEGILSKEFSNTLEEMTTGFKTKNVDLVENAINRVMGNTKTLFNNDMEISQADAQAISRKTGQNIGTTVRKLPLRETIQNTFDMISRFESSGGDRSVELAMGKGSKMRAGEITENVAKRMAIANGTQGTFSKVASAMIESKNRLGAIGQSMISNHKALGIGFAAALGIGALLSDPPKTVGAGSNLVPKGESPPKGVRPSSIPQVSLSSKPGRGASEISADSVSPPQQQRGDPTAPNMTRSKNSYISGSSNSSFTINARSRSTQDTQRLTRGIGGQSSSTSINLRDNRSSMDKHTILNELM